MNDLFYMKEALKEAEKAFKKEEAPIGAVAVHEGKIVARAHNIREALNDPLGHAELILLKKLSRQFKNWRLLGVTIYVTLEPCLMCRGAIFQARIQRLVFGAMDTKGGEGNRLHHRLEVTQGLLGEECSRLLTKFFKARRQ